MCQTFGGALASGLEMELILMLRVMIIDYFNVDVSMVILMMSFRMTTFLQKFSARELACVSEVLTFLLLPVHLSPFYHDHKDEDGRKNLPL